MTRAGTMGQGGVSLVELLMALAISATLMAPLAVMLNTSVKADADTSSRRPLQQDLNFALERIAAQVRATPRKTLSPNALASDSGSWFAARYIQQADQLIERLSGTDRVIADGVTTFSITAKAVGADNTLVEATLVLTRGTEAATGTTVLRLGGAP
jgi:prepilin-type N-terminal cleavage/methylation domain-containing protein